MATFAAESKRSTHRLPRRSTRSGSRGRCATAACRARRATNPPARPPPNCSRPCAPLSLLRLWCGCGAAVVQLFRGDPVNNRVLNFAPREQSPERPSTSDDTLRMLYTLNRQSMKRASWTSRYIPQSPERILDAPELLDDYYLNLLDWNAENILGARTRTAAPGVPGSPCAPPH